MANTSTSGAQQHGAIGAVLKAAYPKLVAALVRGFGDVDRAEDAASEDRSRWQRSMIEEGLALINGVFMLRPPPSSVQLQAAISALHCEAKTSSQTDWPQIVALYERLIEYDDSPVVLVNHASAVAFGGHPIHALSR